MDVGQWSFEPSELIPILGITLLYWARTRHLAAGGRPVAGWRRMSFYCGIVAALGALVSPIDWLGENRLLWVHMVQHVMLLDLVPLPIVLGLTGPVLRPLLAIRAVRPLRVLTHPFVSLPLWIVVLYVWHLPFMYQAALDHSGVHALEHASFVLAGGFMWATVIEPLPGPVWFGSGYKALYTLFVRAAGMALANVFIWDAHVIYPHYLALDRIAHTSPLTDQRIAGFVMFIWGGLFTMGAFAWLLLRFAQEMEVRQRLIERQVDVDAASRAARYGRSARAREVSRQR